MGAVEASQLRQIADAVRRQKNVGLSDPPAPALHQSGRHVQNAGEGPGQHLADNYRPGRYGGLRRPSQVLSLRWQDIDWESGRMRVTSPKTERLAGKDSRLVPVFLESRPYLEEAFPAAPEGTVYVVERYRQASMVPKGWRNCNLRTQFERIIKRAGL